MNWHWLQKTKKVKDNSNITPELLEAVERYDNGTMAEQERLNFEKQLQEDAAFKVKVEDIRTTLLGIETQSLREQLDAYHKEIPKENSSTPPPSKTRFFSFSKIAIAAGLLLVFGLFWFMGRNSSPDQLYAKYFTPDPGLPTTMSASENFEFYDAMVNYKQGEYSTAISKWENLEHKMPNNDTLNYFLGVAHLANKNTAKAELYLNKTITNKESVFLEDAYFYLGLSYLKSDQPEDATRAFEQSNSEKSQDILKKLN